jgi:hypothetical protein
MSNEDGGRTMIEICNVAGDKTKSNDEKWRKDLVKGRVHDVHARRIISAGRENVYINGRAIVKG